MNYLLLDTIWLWTFRGYPDLKDIGKHEDLSSHKALYEGMTGRVVTHFLVFKIRVNTKCPNPDRLLYYMWSHDKCHFGENNHVVTKSCDCRVV